MLCKDSMGRFVGIYAGVGVFKVPPTLLCVRGGEDFKVKEGGRISQHPIHAHPYRI